MPTRNCPRICFAVLVSALILSLIGVFLSIPHPVTAAPTTKIETQINIIDSIYSTTNRVSGQPSDNRLGLILWDDTLYNDETVYYEAVIRCDSCSGGNAQVLSELYTDSGTAVTGSTATTTNSAFTLVRSGAITGNLTNGEEYAARIMVDATTGTAQIQAARLIVVQNGTLISDTVNQIEIGSSDNTTNTSYTLIRGPKIWLFDSDRHSDIQNIYFETTLQGSDAGAVSYAALSTDTNCSTTVTNTEVSVTGTAWARARSTDIETYLSDDTEYWVCTKTTAADTGYIANGKIIIEQSNASGISDMELVHQYMNRVLAETSLTYNSQLFENTYTPGNFSADSTLAYFESTLYAQSGTGYAQLYNVTDTSAISNSELTQPNNSYQRKRSSELFSGLPTSQKNLDTQLKNSVAGQTRAATTWLIIYLHANTDPALTFRITGVAADSVYNDITTSQASTYSTLPFSNLTFGTPKYVAHELYASTNATSGYTVTMEMLAFLQGIYPGNNIDPFISTWASPTTWTEPTGTVVNVNTGWIGANTTDTRVSGWGSASQKFGPVESTAHPVMTATGPDTGTTIYVTYATEVNIFQPADAYSGTLMYNIIPTY